MRKHEVGYGFYIETERKAKSYILERISYKGVPIMDNWVDIATFSLIAQEFGNKNMLKDITINLNSLVFDHVEKDGNHFLRIKVQGDTLFLNTFESKRIPAILNRVISRCDILDADTIMEDGYMRENFTMAN